MEKDGAYHVAAIDEGQPVRLSEDYFIATDKAQPPEISHRPAARRLPRQPHRRGHGGREGGGSVRAERCASSLLGERRAGSRGEPAETPGAKNADGSHTLPLEDFKLVPGDVVSLYATARDGTAEARTDIAFIQVDPFEREFSQSQQSGGGGGGGGGGAEQPDRNLQARKGTDCRHMEAAERQDRHAEGRGGAGQFLSDAQQKLRDQVLALVGSHAEPRSLRGKRGVHRLRQGHAGCRRGHGAFGRQAESHAVEGCDAAGAEGAAGAAARRGDLPQDPGGLRPERRRRRCGGGNAGPRSGQPLRSRTGHGEEPVRDGAEQLLPRSSTRRMSRTRSRSSMRWPSGRRS